MAHPQYMPQVPAPQPQPQTSYGFPPNPNYPVPSTPVPVSQAPPLNGANYPYTPTPGQVPVSQAGLAQPAPQPNQPNMQQPGQLPGQQLPGQQLPGQQLPGQQLPGQQLPGQPPVMSQALPAGYHTVHYSAALPPGAMHPQQPGQQYVNTPYPQYYTAPAGSAVPGGFPNGQQIPGFANSVPGTPGAPPGAQVSLNTPVFIQSPFQTFPNHITGPGQGPVGGHGPLPGANPGLVPQPTLGPSNTLHYQPTNPGSNPRTITQPPEIKLEIMAKQLWDRDTVSKSDPTCVVFMEDRRGNAQNFTVGYDNANVDNDDVSPGETGGPPRPSIRWKEVGRTECLKNNLNPHFKVQITVPYVFEQLQHIKFGLWDIDSKKQTDLDSHDFLGEARTTIGELVMSGNWTSALASPNAREMRNMFGGRRNLGTVTVIVHENRDAGNVLIKAHLSGRKLDRKDFGISSDPYFIVTQVGGRTTTTTGKNPPSVSRSQLYESEVIRRNVNPTWKPFHIRVAKPKGGSNADMKVEFLVNDKDNHSRDDEIGKVTLTVDELEKTSEVPLSNGRRHLLSKKPKICGYLRFSSVKIIPMPSLVDYLQGGLKLHFSVAVDLTASNGNPNEPLSLHYCQDFYQGNQYTRALTAIANVLHVYAPPDQLFAAFGFGAVLPAAPGYTNSCFPLSLRPDPMCHGLQGILEAYVTALRTVKLSGPTNFAPLIDTVSRTAAQRLNTQTDQNYDILLILTDGVVSDFDLTVDQIISASHMAPLSIIIIGIGNRNFEKMKELDSDGKLLTSADGNRQAARDICQFVAFNDHEGQSPERLGAAVLAEVPGNIVEYFAGICNPPINPGRRPDHLSNIPY